MLISCNNGRRMMPHEGARIHDVEGITVIDLHGSWYQMGRQYGKLASSRMKDVLEYLDRKIGTDPERMASAEGIADSLYAGYPPHLKEFLKGSSQTSGLSLDRIKLCNAAEYVEGVFLCSAMAVWDDYGTGKLVFGRNYDAASYSEIGRDLVVTVYHPDEGIASATVGYAGELYCVNGLNAKGIFIELNNGMPSAGSKIRWDLCPSTTSLFELLFRAGSIDDVDDFFKKTGASLASTIGVACMDGARSYEWCSEGVRRGDVMTGDGLMISTNHYVNDGWSFSTPDDENSWNSIRRRSNLEKMALQYKGAIDVERMKAIMSTSLEEGGPQHSLTRYQIVAVPEDLILHIHFPYNGKWVTLDMKEFLCPNDRTAERKIPGQRKDKLVLSTR